ncbi:MAG: acyl-CoA dehydrogenase family protein, partial [Nocardioides sp.]
MAINLEMPKKLQAVIEKGHQGAAEMLRPISRKYDLAEHEYPKELDVLASLIDGINQGGADGAGAAMARRGSRA